MYVIPQIFVGTTTIKTVLPCGIEETSEQNISSYNTSYKAEVTLNEKDSLQDMLNLEKSAVKLYSTAMTEGCSKGFRTLVKELLRGNYTLK